MFIEKLWCSSSRLPIKDCSLDAPLFLSLGREFSRMSLSANDFRASVTNPSSLTHSFFLLGVKAYVLCFYLFNKNVNPIFIHQMMISQSDIGRAYYSILFIIGLYIVLTALIHRSDHDMLYKSGYRN